MHLVVSYLIFAYYITSEGLLYHASLTHVFFPPALPIGALHVLSWAM